MKEGQISFELKILLGMVALLLFAGAALFFGLTKSDAAAWVQAIGSIAAIIGSFRIAQGQQRESDRGRELEEVSRNARLAYLCEQAAKEATKAVAEVAALYEKHEDGNRLIHSTNRLRNAHSIVVIALSKDIPTDVTYPLIRLQRIIDITIRSVEKRVAKPSVSIGEITLNLAKERVERSEEYRGRIARAAKAYLKLKNSQPSRGKSSSE